MAVNSEDYAIVVGINTYPWLRSLKAALSDAARFTEWLIDPEGGGLPAENVRTVNGPETLPTNTEDIDPTPTHVNNRLFHLGVARNARVGRRLYFYFAGHGIGPSFDDVGMLMAAAAPLRLELNVGLVHLRRYFHAHAVFDEVIFVLDCCRDGTQNTDTGRPDFAKGVAAGPVGDVSDLTIMAAAYGAKAFEPATDGVEPRGLLTTVLLKGLCSVDATDGIGRITSRSLAAYLERQVPLMAADFRLRQRPEVDASRGEIVLGTRTLDTKIRIVARSAFAGDIELLDHESRVLARRAAVDATRTKPAWEVTLDSARWYSVRRSTDPPHRAPRTFEPRTLRRNVLTVRSA